MTKSLKKNVFLSNAQRYEMYNHYMRSMPSDEEIKKDLDLADKIKMRKEKAKAKEKEKAKRGQEQQEKEKEDNKVTVKTTAGVQRPMTYEELINWAVDRYKLNRRPNKSTISRLIARIGEERASGGPERKPNVSRVQKGRFPEIEEAVLEWMDISESKCIPVTWTMIMQKANNVAERKGIEFKGSNGWMDRFIARHDLKKRLARKKVNKSSDDDKE